ncbi:MAG: hypothetical protein ACR5KV_00010 [Wolbachia sp.]
MRDFYCTNFAKKKDPIEENYKYGFACLSIMTPASAAIGFGLATVTTAIFPGIMLGVVPAFLASTIMGIIAPMAVLFAIQYIIRPIAEK